MQRFVRLGSAQFMITCWLSAVKNSLCTCSLITPTSHKHLQFQAFSETFRFGSFSCLFPAERRRSWGFVVQFRRLWLGSVWRCGLWNAPCLSDQSETESRFGQRAGGRRSAPTETPDSAGSVGYPVEEVNACFSGRAGLITLLCSRVVLPLSAPAEASFYRVRVCLCVCVSDASLWWVWFQTCEQTARKFSI